MGKRVANSGNQHSRYAVENLEPRRMLAAITWDGGGNQTSWNDPLNWSTDVIPTADDDVTIGTGVADVRIDNGLAQANSVVTDSPISFADGSVLQTDHYFTDNGSRMTGGTLAPLGNSPTAYIIAGTFDAMTLQSDWVLKLGIRIANGLTVNGVLTAGVPNSGVAGGLEFIESAQQTLGGTGRVDLAVNFSKLILVNSASVSRTLEIGPDITVRTTGGNEWYIQPSDSASGEIINNGRIESAVPGGTLELGTHSSGSLAAKFTNQGTISVINGGKIRTMGTFSTTAPIQIANGDFYMHGLAPTPSINLIERTGPGTTVVFRSIDVTTTPLNLTAVTGSVEIRSGTSVIGPGTVNTSGGARLICNPGIFSPSVLQDVVINGTVELGTYSTLLRGNVTLMGTILGTSANPLRFASGATLVASDGARLSNLRLASIIRVNADNASLYIDNGLHGGAVFLNGANSKVIADGTQTWTNVTTSFLKPSTAIVLKGDAATLTLGTGCSVTGFSGSILEDSSNVQSAALINEGDLNAGVGQTLNVTLAGGVTNIGTVQADAGGSLTINGPFSQTAGSIILNGGSITASSPMNVTGGTYVVRSGSYLFDALAFVSTTPLNIMVEGMGYLTFSASETLLASLIMRQTGIVALSAAGDHFLRVGSLSILDTARLDVTDNALIVDYPSDDSPSPIDTIRTSVASGFNGGAWNGSGIISSIAAVTPGTAIGVAEAATLYGSFPASFAGFTVDSTSVLLRYTRTGDTDLDHDVDLSDLSNLSASYGAASGKLWNQGDLDFDGDVDLNDLGALAAFYGTDISPSGSGEAQTAAAVPQPIVPEPSRPAPPAAIPTTFTNTFHATNRDRSFKGKLLSLDNTQIDTSRKWKARIDWGDGKTSDAKVIYNSKTKRWELKADHKYRTKGYYTISISLV